MEHAYPTQLAAFVQERWNSVAPSIEQHESLRHPEAADASLPPLRLLEDLLSTVYQASLLREEGRAVTFRLIVCDPETLSVNAGPPTGLQRLEFTEPRPLTAHELRRLAPAADFYRSLVGARMNRDGQLEVWGVVQSGTRWLRAVQGGRERAVPLPGALVIAVTAPGHLEVSRGSVFIGRLDKGWLSGETPDVFDSHWLSANFADIRDEVLALHTAARKEAERGGGMWAPLDPDVTRSVAQQMIKRVIAVIAATHHGGTLLIVPPERAEELSRPNPYLTIKFGFKDAAPRRRFHDLIVQVMNRLAEVAALDDCGRINFNRDAASQPVGWREYERANDERLVQLDEAIFEMAHLIAGLAATDGAVVMTKRFELLGFGAEITAEASNVSQVARALDIEGAEREMVTTGRVGTRHRSVYRLCACVPDSLGVVISQDGSVRFVKWMDGVVTYWNQATSSLEF